MSREIPFHKYHGCGNDFILIESEECLSKEIIIQLTDRKCGIGADGVVLYSGQSMRIFNADGQEASMCGNALRCLALHLQKPTGVIQTKVGDYPYQLKGEHEVTVEMQPVALSQQIEEHLYLVHSGTEHLVLFVDDLEAVDFETLAPKWRWDTRFLPNGVNVNFVERLGRQHCLVRVYEKGVEGETKACGTGAYAIASLLDQPEIEISFHSGYALHFKREHERMWMSGPATKVFSGCIDLQQFSPVERATVGHAEST